MRMRRKPWARPELDACPFFVNEPAPFRGKWKDWFKAPQPLQIELGCGKGGFIAQLALENPNINYLAIDIKSEVLAVGRRAIVKLFEENGRTVDNIALMSWNIERIDMLLAPQDKIQRIYINFCNPWPRGKHKKRRLTYTKQLNLYKTFLEKDGEIYFKTDDKELFEESIEYFNESGFEITYITRDLHSSDVVGNIVTEHEKMFSEQGIKINYLVAKNK